MRSFLKSNSWAVLVTILLFVIPFFWLKPNEMDLGGDESRLFFYDPLQYLLHDGIFLSELITLGLRSFDPHFYNIPFFSLLFIIKSVINSPYFLISLLNGIKVSISFLSIYLIIRMIVRHSYKEKNELFLQVPAILGGIVYITAPIFIGNFEKALLSHNQIFLNPLCFYFLLAYFIKKKFRYLIGFIIITFIFASSFSWISAPPLFAFFPLSLSYLFIYVVFILKEQIRYSHVLLALLVFVGLHAFHFIPEMYNLLSPGNYINERVFNKDNVIHYLNYYYGVLPLSKLSLNLFLDAPFKQLSWLAFIPIFFVLLGFVVNKAKNKTFVLTSFFFVVTLYLVTANITASGVKLYELFFYIPGFSMFRNFIGQWAFIFTFFYVLLFGQAVYFVFKKIGNTKIVLVIGFLILVSTVVTGWKFFIGDLVNTVHVQSDNVKIPMVIDPEYEKTLAFIRNLKDDGAFVSFPFTDSYETVVHGINTGAYKGPSPINHLVGRMDYNGYLVISPFGEIFFKLVKEKKYSEIKKLLGLLHVRYIYYNDDPKVYDKTFPGSPYSSARAVFPPTQKEYKAFIKNIVGKEIYRNGNYHIYETDRSYFVEEFYVPQSLKTYKNPKTELYMQQTPFFDATAKGNEVYLDDSSCLKLFSRQECTKNKLSQGPTIQVERVNPVMYRLHVKNATEGYLLVLSRSFHNNWDISFAKEDMLQDTFWPHKIHERQVLANGYSNAWYILPHDVEGKSEYTLTVQLNNQKIFYIGALISIITLIGSILVSIFFLFRR